MASETTERLDLEFCPRCGSGPRQKADTVDCPDCGYRWAGPRLRDLIESDEQPVVKHECRCGHDRDDHQSKSWQEGGEKFYGQVCELCNCKNYVEKGGFTDSMIDLFKPKQ